MVSLRVYPYLFCQGLGNPTSPLLLVPRGQQQPYKRKSTISSVASASNLTCVHFWKRRGGIRRRVNVCVALQNTGSPRVQRVGQWPHFEERFVLVRMEPPLLASRDGLHSTGCCEAEGLIIVVPAEVQKSNPCMRHTTARMRCAPHTCPSECTEDSLDRAHDCDGFMQHGLVHARCVQIHGRQKRRLAGMRVDPPDSHAPVCLHRACRARQLSTHPHTCARHGHMQGAP